MGRAKRYIKIIILKSMPPGGCIAKDLIDEVSKRLGEPISVQKIGSYLSKMFISGEVWREEETRSGCMKRYRWFRTR